jgi:hypothetical protein
MSASLPSFPFPGPGGSEAPRPKVSAWPSPFCQAQTSGRPLHPSHLGDGHLATRRCVLHHCASAPAQCRASGKHSTNACGDQGRSSTPRRSFSLPRPAQVSLLLLLLLQKPLCLPGEGPPTLLLTPATAQAGWSPQAGSARRSGTEPTHRAKARPANQRPAS